MNELNNSYSYVEKEPEIIITTTDNNLQRKVLFSKLFELKSNINSLLLLWDYNTYYLNIDNSYFIINGGKRIQPIILQKMENRKLEYARRNKCDISSDGSSDLKNVRVSYLIGITGLVDKEQKSILLHISSDGKLWTWCTSR